tara:strand:+ start:689 stop:1555 length:867 start_codon:yes stop_codon:yes gene_type:complete
MTRIENYDTILKEYEENIKDAKIHKTLDYFIDKYNLKVPRRRYNLKERKEMILKRINGEDININIKNKGTGAGGANTNKNGSSFEERTCFKKRIIDKDSSWEKKIIKQRRKGGVIYSKTMNDYSIIYVKKSGLRFHLKKDEKDIYREPDEAFIIEFKDKTKRPLLKILEKKDQNRTGSVDIKLDAGLGLIREYQQMLPDYDISYAFLISEIFETKILKNNKNKYNHFLQRKKEEDIKVVCEKNIDDIDNWIFNDLNSNKSYNDLKNEIKLLKEKLSKANISELNASEE